MPRRRTTWVKTHPLEGDGLLINFYNYMWRKNKEFESCPEVLFPDTVVYDHNFPRGWFTYERVGRRGDKSGELKKKQGKELDTSSIWEVFKKQADPSIDIVASYLYASEDPDTGEPRTSVEFFDRDGLSEFLNNRKEKKEGILQRFLLPKGTNNTLIQVVWSPRVCIMQRKTNTHALADRSYPPYVRAVTYEGASHHCEDGICAPRTTARIKTVCNNICLHFNSLEHGKVITRMVLYFKVDRNDNVWLLWCGSIRISDRQVRSMMPVNMAPIFSSPDAHQPVLVQGHDTTSDVLLRADHSQLKLGQDHIHYRACCKSPVSRSPSPRRAWRNDHQGLSGRDDGKHDVVHGAEDRGMAADSRLRRRIAALRTDWMLVTPLIEQEWRRIEEDRATAQTLLSDIFYEAYSHFQMHRQPFFFTLPGQLRTLLGPQSFTDLIDKLRLERVPAEEFPEQEFGELDFWLRDRQTVPVSKLGSEAANRVSAHFDRCVQVLKDKAMPFAEQAAINVAKDEHSLLPENEEPASKGMKADAGSRKSSRGQADPVAAAASEEYEADEAEDADADSPEEEEEEDSRSADASDAYSPVSAGSEAEDVPDEEAEEAEPSDEEAADADGVEDEADYEDDYDD